MALGEQARTPGGGRQEAAKRPLAWSNSGSGSRHVFLAPGQQFFGVNDQVLHVLSGLAELGLAGVVA
jgi:hypothetical protein